MTRRFADVNRMMKRCVSPGPFKPEEDQSGEQLEHGPLGRFLRQACHPGWALSPHCWCHGVSPPWLPRWLDVRGHCKTLEEPGAQGSPGTLERRMGEESPARSSDAAVGCRLPTALFQARDVSSSWGPDARETHRERSHWNCGDPAAMLSILWIDN